MATINVLDRNTINRIAAGEVIERPASVVKELIENSIDAGATAVTCEIRGGGIDLIRITDNGSGIPHEDIRTAFLRHATSKIKDADDLESVLSFGFRGEALASIAAVARVELITKTRSSFTGDRYVIEGGEEVSFEEIGCPDGTTFIVHELFANVPVRRKFLKTPVTEAAYVTEAVERLALSHPGVGIKFINNGKTVVFTSGSNSVKTVIYGIYGRDIASELIEVNGERSGISISGYIASPSVARANRNTETYYVNGRFIRSNVISKAIEDAYSGYLMQHKYPFTALLISIPTSSMDVNVHPTKQEVRFADNETVYDAVFHIVRDVLDGRTLVPDMTEEPAAPAQVKAEREAASRSFRLAPEPFENSRREAAQTFGEASARGFAESRIQPEAQSVTRPEVQPEARSVTWPAAHPVEQSVTRPEAQPEVRSVTWSEVQPEARSVTRPEAQPEARSVTQPEVQPEMQPETPADEAVRTVMTSDKSSPQLVFDMTASDKVSIREETREDFKNGLNDNYRIVGQLFDTYWVIARGETMFIIDQHAAHEKILYERFMKLDDDAEILSQSLSPSIIISLSPSECICVDEHFEELKKAGFTVEHFGGREYSVSTVPLKTYGLDEIALLTELIDSFMSPSGAAGKAQSLRERLATCSCKAAVKGNMRLSGFEARALIEELLTLENPFNCPHGRPVMISMTEQELEKKFKRII